MEGRGRRVFPAVARAAACPAERRPASSRTAAARRSTRTACATAGCCAGFTRGRVRTRRRPAVTCVWKSSRPARSGPRRHAAVACHRHRCRWLGGMRDRRGRVRVERRHHRRRRRPGLVDGRRHPRRGRDPGPLHGACDVCRITMPRPGVTFTRPAGGELHRQARLGQARTLGIPPSDLADDATFLRRVYLDTIGTLPTAAEARPSWRTLRPTSGRS